MSGLSAPVSTLSILSTCVYRWGDHNYPLSTWEEGWEKSKCTRSVPSYPRIILLTILTTFLLLVFTYLSLELLWNVPAFKPELLCMSFVLQFSSVLFSGEGRSHLSTSICYLDVSECPRGRICVTRACLSVLTAAEWPSHWDRYSSGELCAKQKS